MGQYLGGVVNVAVGFYTGNVWEMVGGVMQIVGTKTNNSDLATAGAVVGTVAGVAGAASAASDATPVADANGNYTAANAAAMGAPATTGDAAQAAAISGQTAAPSTLSVNGAAAGGAIPPPEPPLTTWDKVTNALSTPTGVQITAGVIGGMGNAYGQAYAAQKTAEAQQALQNQSIAFRQWQAGIANTAGTGVVNAAAPMQYGAGLLGPQSPVATPISGLPVSPNPLAPTPAMNPLTPTPAGLTV